ncbi:hypothetical protein [Nocardia sp. XZ_19_369]|uniref:hypothetical protein n=1 Tax=Nocardia sp. XZ_19_369 TaxID=2769487 RepID=UPI00188FC388|nr:hypothetical protein [Nocardia sp. XZ_19_369]
MTLATTETATRIDLSPLGIVILGSVLLAIWGVVEFISFQGRLQHRRKVKKAAVRRRAEKALQRRHRKETAGAATCFGAEIGPVSALPLNLYTAATSQEVNQTALAVLDRLEAEGLAVVSLRIGVLGKDGKTFARNLKAVEAPIAQQRKRIQSRQNRERSLDAKRAQGKAAAREERAATSRQRFTR